MALTDGQTLLVSALYAAALIPTIFIALSYVVGKLPKWILGLFIAAFIVAALGWELWISYGLVDGLDVTERRPPALNNAVPLHMNWLLNSLADAGVVGLTGVLLVWLGYGRTNRAFVCWRWGAVAILCVWFVGQNLLVELYIYQQQLAAGLRLSWAPLMPTGPWYNPQIVHIDGRTVHLQTQLTWVLMTPIYYRLLLWSFAKWGADPVGGKSLP